VNAVSIKLSPRDHEFVAAGHHEFLVAEILNVEFCTQDRNGLRNGSSRRIHLELNAVPIKLSRIECYRCKANIDSFSFFFLGWILSSHSSAE
jgi:hypothetical protein